MTADPAFDAITSQVSALFEQAGVLPATAASVARALVAAEACGLKGHGLSRLPTYLAMVKSGKIDGKAIPVASRPRPGVLAIDAAFGFAYPALDLALVEVPEIARAQGIALVPIRNSNHCGAAGLPCEALARQGFVAILFANTPAAMAPWGGSRALFGTNPIAFAAPVSGRDPVVIDLSLSKVARGNLLAAKQKGQPIPEGWAVDADGKPTTDPDKGLKGTMVPAGEAKGAALALMVEILAAALVGAHFAYEASSFLDAEGGPPATGQLLLVIDPSGMGHDGFARRMGDLAAAFDADAGARLPGTRRTAARAAAASAGISLPPELLAAATRSLA